MQSSARGQGATLPESSTSSSAAHTGSPGRSVVDRSRNVIIFGVPESRSLLDTESLVSRAFDFAVGRRVEFVDCRRLGK